MYQVRLEHKERNDTSFHTKCCHHGELSKFKTVCFVFVGTLPQI